MKVKVYYDFISQTWFHNEKAHTSLSFGEGEEIKFINRKKKAFLPFTMSFRNQEIVGPVVGIVVNRNEGKSFAGNIKLLERIQKELFHVGGFSVVLTEDYFADNSVKEAFCYHPNYGKWIKIIPPPIHILYNRMYKESDWSIIIDWCNEREIPYFNEKYFDKLSTFLCLKENVQLSPHLPSTSLLTEQNFYEFLSNYRSVYIKKRKSAKGKGIYSLTLHGNVVILKTISNTMMFPSINKAFVYLQRELNLNEYILQQTIETVKLNGRKFDLRILAHYLNNQHIISGVGVRIANNQQVTTHVPNGGIIGNIEQLPIPINIEKLKSFISNIGRELSIYEGSLIGEFSADIGLTQDGSFYLFEVNAKPMDFDEVDIKEAGTKNLIRVFYENAKFFKMESQLVE